MIPDLKPCLDIRTTDNTASPHPDAVMPTHTTDNTLPLMPSPMTFGDSFSIPEIPPFPDFTLGPTIVPSMEDMQQSAEVQQVRSLINAMIALKLSNGCLLPLYIGCPPQEYLYQVEHDVISFLAKTEWEKADKPRGRDLEFWTKAEARYKRAFHYWI